MAKTYNNFSDLFKDLKKDIHKDPNKYLDEQAKEKLVGKKSLGICPECKVETEVEILKDGKVRCEKCNKEFKVDFNWDVKIT